MLRGTRQRGREEADEEFPCRRLKERSGKHQGWSHTVRPFSFARAPRVSLPCVYLHPPYALSPTKAGSTYCALAALHLSARLGVTLSAAQQADATRWLLALQQPGSGFAGRVGKEADVCYSFWAGASLSVRHPPPPLSLRSQHMR
jgi:hypothetical protein